MDQTIKNGRSRLNSVAGQCLMVDRYMVEGIFEIKNRTYNYQLIVCVFIQKTRGSLYQNLRITKLIIGFRRESRSSYGCERRIMVHQVSKQIAYCPITYAIFI